MVFERKLSEEEKKMLLKMQDFVKVAHAESSSHDFAHVLCVCRYAIQIGQQIPEIADPFIVCAGALLHDIGKTNTAFAHIHGLLGGALAEEFLDGLNVDPVMRDGICRAVIRHTPTSMIPPETTEEKIVYDADTLDRIGLMGLLRGFIGKQGAMHKIIRTYSKKRMLDFGKLHYDVSRDIGIEHNEMMKAFMSIIDDRLKTRMNNIEDFLYKEGLFEPQ